MNKIILTLIFLFLGIVNVLACKCGSFGSIGENYSNSQIIGEITINKIYQNNSKDRTYKTDVTFENIYKGKAIKTILVEGIINDVQTAACEIELKVGEKYLIYLYEYNGEFYISACTPKFLTGTKEQLFDYKALDLQRQALSFLKNNPQNSDFVFYFNDPSVNGEKSVFAHSNLKPSNQFAIYKLKVNEKSRVSAISPVSSFGNIDDYVEDTIKNKFTILKGFMEEVKNEDVLLLMFYVPENEDQEYKEIITGNLD